MTIKLAASLILAMAPGSFARDCAVVVRSVTDLGETSITRVCVLDGVAFVYGKASSYAFDVADPSTLRLLAKGPALPSTWVKDFAFLPGRIVVAGNGIGLLDPKRPAGLAPKHVIGNGLFTSIAADGSRIYAATFVGNESFLHVLDMSDPVAPLSLAVHQAEPYKFFGPMGTVLPNFLAAAYGDSVADVVLYDLSDPTLLVPAAVILPKFASVSIRDVTASPGRVHVGTDWYNAQEVIELDTTIPTRAKQIASFDAGQYGEASVVASSNYVAFTRHSLATGAQVHILSRQIGPSKPIAAINLSGKAVPATFPIAMHENLIFVANGGVLTIIEIDPLPCHADCDCSASLNIDDFICYQTRFALGDPYADCDADGSLSIDDFVCFQAKFSLGC
jgi:hypothetical protein